MPKRAARRRAERTRRRAEPPKGLSDRDKLGVELMVQLMGLETVREPEVVEALRNLLDEIPVDYTGPVELPPALRHLQPGPLPAPDASEAWPENIAAHDQATAALVDLLNLEHTPSETAAVFETLTRIGQTMPTNASASAVIEHDGEHILATLNDPGDGLAVTFEHYGPSDPKRRNPPANTETFPRPPP